MSTTSGDSSSRDHGRPTLTPQEGTRDFHTPAVTSDHLFQDEKTVPGSTLKMQVPTSTEDIFLRAQAEHDRMMTEFRQGTENFEEFFHLQAERDRIRQADPPLVTTDFHQWIGPQQLHPPFSVAQFQADFNSLQHIGRGASGAQHGWIGGIHYLVKEVAPQHCLPAGRFQLKGEEFAEILNPSRYEANAEVAATLIAEEIGQGHYVSRAYAFNYDGHQFVASQFLENIRPLYEVLHHNSIESLPNKEATTSQLADTIVRDYLFGDEDRHEPNFGADPSTREVYSLDYARSFRYEGAHLLQSSAISLFIAATGGNADRAYIPKGSIQNILAHEQAILRIVSEQRLDAGLHGVRRRLHRLEILNQQPGDISLSDFGITQHLAVHTELNAPTPQGMRRNAHTRQE